MFRAKAAWMAALMMVGSVGMASSVSDSARARITLIIPPSFKVEGLSQVQATESRQYRADQLCLRGPRSMDYSLQVRDDAGQISQAQADFIPANDTPDCHGKSASLLLRNGPLAAQDEGDFTLMIIAE
ncbi:MAG: hypothetical protein V7688_04385 [Alcanivorax jadensis]|uniref:hypothetical protein n=1 Tax=Alcanivorax jadensis TaxID=64988 RepID=UPI0030032121